MTQTMSKGGLDVSYLPLATLKPYPKNARTHSKKQIAQVAASIRSFGFNVPIVVDEDNTVLAGHARLTAANTLGLETVPCVRLSHMSKAQKKAFILTTNSIDGSIHMVFMDWRHMVEVQAAGSAVYSELKNLIVWVKDNGGMGSFYRSRHELIFAFKSGTGPHVNSFELGQHGRYRTNVWTYKGMNSFGGKRDEELGLHPTVKPVALLADAMKDVSIRGSIVLDLFGGSGSMLIAAHKTGRRGYLMELDALYCDRCLRRWEAYAKDDAILETTGQTFAEVATERQAHSPGKRSTA